MDNRTYNDYERVTFNNLYNWAIGWHSSISKEGIVVPASAKEYRLCTVAEVLDQIMRNNVAFCGTDGIGSHAAFQINDKELRKILFKTDREPQQFTPETVGKMLSQKSKEAYRTAINDTIVTESEARMMMVIKDDYNFRDMPVWKTEMLLEHCQKILNSHK